MLKSRFACGLVTALCFSVGHAEAFADEPLGLCGTSLHAIQPTENSLAGRQVELFKAIADDDIDAELIAPSAREVWLRVTNKTDKPLSIDLPDAFAAVPVLGQMAPVANIGGPNGLGLPGIGAQNNLGPGANPGNFGNVPGGIGQGGQAQGTQGLGGGFNNGGNAIGNVGVGNVGVGNVGPGNWLGNGVGNPIGNAAPFRRGMFRVPAGRVGKVRAVTVCLEHGKPEPNSRMRYRIVPIEDLNGDRRIARICHLLATREITQNVAQATAWHIANDLSWEELAAKERSRSKYTGSQKFFTNSELQEAMRVAGAIEEPATSVLTSQTSTSSGLFASPR